MVVSRNANAGSARLAEVMAKLIPRLHAAIKDIGPTLAEWFEAVLFLTRTGQISNEWRQEWIVLSDTTGVPMLVKECILALGRHPFRPAHLHYSISADGFDTLSTHIFDPDDPNSHSDAVLGVKQSLIASFKLIHDRARQSAAGYLIPCYEVAHDFTLAPAK